MSTYLQGIAAEFGKFFQHGDEVIYLPSGSIVMSDHVKLLTDHEGKSYGTTADILQVHIGDEAIGFRFEFPNNYDDELATKADDFDSYIAVSVGLNITKFKTMIIDGVKAKVITEGTLKEISLIRGEPAIKGTYARLVTPDTCGELEDDFERMRLVGRYVSLHRAQKAAENSGVIQYHHITSDYERAASRLRQALQSLL